MRRFLAGLRAWIGSISWKRSTEYQATGNQETNPLPGSKSLILCSSLEQLLFTDFIKCMCDKDYSCLLRSGTATPDELTAAWIVLAGEYQKLTGSVELEHHLSITSKIEHLNTKINIVSCLVDAIKLEYNEDFINELKEWEYDYPFTRETLERNLQQVMASLGNDKTRLAMARKEYENEQEQHGDEQTATKEAYMSALYAIEEKKKMEFDLEKLTAYKFAIEYKKLIDYNKLLKSKYSGYGTK